MADFRNTTNQLSSAKRIKTGLRSQPLVTTAPEYRQKSLNIFRIRHTQVQKLAVNLSLDTDEIDSIERDRLLGLDAKFTSRTKAKKFIKIEELLLNRSKFSEVDFCFMGDEGSDTKAISLSKSLSKYHSLKDVTLNFLWCQNLSQNGIRSLAKNLLKLNHLNDLSIAYKNFYKGDQFITGLSSTAQTFQRYFSQTQLVLSLHENNIGYQFKGTNTQPQNEDLDGLSFSYTRSLTSSDDPKKLLSQLKKLTTSLSNVVSIKLDFQGWNQLNNADLVVLKELINDLPHLSTIELNLAKCNDITDIGMFILRDILTNKPNLKHLKLGLSNLYLTDNGVLALAEAILSLRKLHSLDLDFSGLQKITSVAILGQILTQLDLLESLVVQFEGCGKITDEEIKLIQFSHNKVHEKMKKMVLNFKACKEITNEGIKDLSLGIESLKKLEHFSLCLNRCPRITDEGLKQLADTMSQNFHNLIGIALSFSTCQKITDEGISYLASVIGESNLYLEQIDLQFSLCHEVTFKGLETTLNSLSKQLKKLKKLSLDFSSCAKITDEALKELKSDLEIYFEALQELSLCLSSKQVSETGLNSIMTLFKNLNRLSIQLKRSQLLTDEGVKRLGSHIMMQFDKLKKLDLDFESCELISDEGIKKLVSEFVSRLKSLESFSLNLSKCNQVTKDIKGHVKRTLSFLPEINL